jgi:sulfonate transport system substrate-binding protein
MNNIQSVVENARRNRRVVLKLGLAGAAASVVGVPTLAARPSVARAQTSEVRVGYQKGAPTLLVLKAQGEFEKRLSEIGDIVTWTEFQAGPPLLEALNAGAIDFGLTGAPPPIFAQAAGADLVYILATKPSPHTEAIVVPPDSAIKALADLKGKKVAVTKGSSANALLVIALQAAGLQWGDAEPVYLLPADAKAAYEGGSVDAWSIWDPYLAIEETDTEARTVATAGDVKSPNRAFYLASRAFATGNTKALEILQDTLSAAEAWSAEHPEEVAKLINGETSIDVDILLKTEERRTFGVEPITKEIVADQQGLADLFHDIGLIPERIDVSSATLLTQTTT